MNRALRAGEQASMKNAYERLGALEFEKQLREPDSRSLPSFGGVIEDRYVSAFL
jgi:hypothetical protein